MSQTITLKLSDTDAAMLSELSEKEGKTREELVLEALHNYFCSAVLITRSFLFHLMSSRLAPR